MINYHKRLIPLLFLPLLFSDFALANVDYRWKATKTGGIIGYGSTPSEAVENLSASYYVHSCQINSPTSATCWFDTVSPPAKYFLKEVHRTTSSCPEGTEFDPTDGSCSPIPEPEPEPIQCEAGEQSSTRKFFEDGVVAGLPPKLHVNGCVMEYVGKQNCAWPYTKDGVLGSMCDVVYEFTGQEAPTTDNEIPGEGTEEGNVPDKLPDEDTASPSGPDPDENNSCPPGYMMQGNTCFRIPPEHPDYDPDKDPMPGGGSGNSGNNGDGDQDGDWAKESTLKGIEKTLKDIDKTGKAIESATKTGNATTEGLLRDIKDAIENIPGGGGGTDPGTGGDGDGEEGGDFDGSCEGEICGFGERDLFGEEVPSFSDSLQSIHTGIKNSPIGQSIGAIQFPSGGTCPTGSISIDVMGQSMPLVFDSHCDLWETIKPIISAAFLALWALIAVRVFLSA